MFLSSWKLVLSNNIIALKGNMSSMLICDYDVFRWKQNGAGGDIVYKHMVEL